MDIQTVTRRKILSTVATLAVGTPLLKRTSFAAVKAVTSPEPVNLLLTLTGNQLTFTLSQLKARLANPRDTSESVGLLSALFASWKQDGTTAKLQSQLTPEYVTNFRVTDKFKLDLERHAALLNFANVSVLKAEDLGQLEVLDYSKLSANVEANMSLIVGGLRMLAIDQQNTKIEQSEPVYHPTGWIPYDQYCRTVQNLTAAAGLTAALAAFFAPPVAGVFGIVAGIGAAASTLNGC